MPTCCPPLIFVAQVGAKKVGLYPLGISSVIRETDAEQIHPFVIRYCECCEEEIKKPNSPWESGKNSWRQD